MANQNWMQDVQNFGDLSKLPPALWAQLQAGQPVSYGGYTINPQISRGYGESGLGNDTLQGYGVTPDGMSIAPGGSYGFFDPAGKYSGAAQSTTGKGEGIWQLMAAAAIGGGALAGSGVLGGAAGAGTAATGTAAGTGGVAGTAGTAATGAVGATGAAATGAAGAGSAGVGAGTLGATGAAGAGLAGVGAAGSGAGVLGTLGQYAGPIASGIAGIIGANAAKSAGNTQADAANAATQLQRDIFNKQVELNAPFRDAGLTAQNKLLTLLGLSGDPSAAGYGSLTAPAPGMHDFTMADYQADPGYKFRMDQGIQAQERGAAAAGRLGSGRYLKDLTTFGQGLASQEYGNAFDRFQTTQNTDFNRYQVNRSNVLNPLQSLLGQGQSATDQVTNAAGNYGSKAGDNIIGAGNARAAGTVGASNALSNGLAQGYSSYQGNQLLGMLRPPGQSGYSSGGYGGYGGYGGASSGGGFGTGAAYGNQDYGQYF